jgi:hypothetical protein
MVRSVFGKVMWVGRATVFLVGLAVILALVFGMATAAFAALSKPGDPFKLGVVNEINRLTTLVGAKSGAMLKVDNNGTGSALQLEAGAGKPPLVVKANSGTATNFSADRLDGMDSSQLAPRGYAQVSVSCAATSNPATTNLCQFSNSKGIIGIKRPDPPGNVYCFDLSFTPKTAVASAHINNNATVGTVLGSGVPSSCPQPYRDAAAKTYAANTSAVLSDINFGIAFM